MNKKNAIPDPLLQQNIGENLARAIQLAHARVLDQEDELLAVATHTGEVRLMPKADSCLLMPEKGDLVLVALAPGKGESHILSVLRKAQSKEQKRRYAFAPDAEISAGPGELALQAHTLRMTGDQHTALSAGELAIDAVKGHARFGSFTLASEQIHAVAEQAKVLVRNLDQRTERVMQRLGNCFRRIQGMEHVVAGRVALSVRDRLTQKAKNASLEADERVAINAEHIDVG